MSQPTCPLSQRKTIEEFFLEHRGKLLDIAAFLDRIDRSQPTDDLPDPESDFRVKALLEGMKLVADGQPNRAARLLEHFSDPTTEPIPQAHTKAAFGAYDGEAK